MPASLPSRREPAAESASFDFFASDAHYRSLGQRIVAALEGDRGVVLVTSEPPASPLLLSEAINREAAARFVVIGVSCGPELTCEGLVRAVPTLAARAASLFVLDEADRLSDAQLEEVYEAVLHGDRTVAAAVLLARPGFVQRLERPGLHFLKDGFTARFDFQRLGGDEVGAFLRRQLRLAADTSTLPAASLAAIAEAAAGDPAVASRLAQRLLQDGGAKGSAPASPVNDPSEEETETAPEDSSPNRPFQLLHEPPANDDGAGDDGDETHDANATAILGSLDEISQAITDAAGERGAETEPESVSDLAAALLGQPANGAALSPATEPRLAGRQARGRRLRLAAIICAAYLAIVAAASVAVFSLLHPAPDSTSAQNKRAAGSWLAKAAEDLLSRERQDGEQVARIEPAPTSTSAPPAATETPATPPKPSAAAVEAALTSPLPAETSAQDEATAAVPTATTPAQTAPDEAPASEPPATTPALAEGAPPPLPPLLPGSEPPASATAAPVTATPAPAPAPVATPEPKPAAPEAPKAAAPETKTADAADSAPAPAPAPAETETLSPPASSTPVEQPAAAAAAPVAAPPAPAKPALPPAEIVALRARGDALLATGDIVSARLFYERAAEGSDAQAALLAGQTFDPGFLARAGVRGVRGDRAQAAQWYRRASALGSAEADRRLKILGK